MGAPRAPAEPWGPMGPHGLRNPNGLQDCDGYCGCICVDINMIRNQNTELQLRLRKITDLGVLGIPEVTSASIMWEHAICELITYMFPKIQKDKSVPIHIMPAYA